MRGNNPRIHHAKESHVKKKNQKTLTLGRETVRSLTNAQLTRVAGGTSYYPGETVNCFDSSDLPWGSGAGSGGGYISYVP